MLCVHWLRFQRVASVAPHVAVCDWLRGVQGMFNKLRSNCKGDFTVYVFDVHLPRKGEKRRRQATPLTRKTFLALIPVTNKFINTHICKKKLITMNESHEYNEGCRTASSQPDIVKFSEQAVCRQVFAQLDKFEKGHIVSFRETGWTFRRIARLLNRSAYTVSRCWTQWEQEGAHTLRGGLGRPRRNTSRKDRFIVLQVVSTGHVTAAGARLDVIMATHGRQHEAIPHRRQPHSRVFTRSHQHLMLPPVSIRGMDVGHLVVRKCAWSHDNCFKCCYECTSLLTFNVRAGGACTSRESLVKWKHAAQTDSHAESPADERGLNCLRLWGIDMLLVVDVELRAEENTVEGAKELLSQQSGGGRGGGFLRCIKPGREITQVVRSVGRQVREVAMRSTEFLYAESGVRYARLRKPSPTGVRGNLKHCVQSTTNHVNGKLLCLLLLLGEFRHPICTQLWSTIHKYEVGRFSSVLCDVCYLLAILSSETIVPEISRIHAYKETFLKTIHTRTATRRVGSDSSQVLIGLQGYLEPCYLQSIAKLLKGAWRKRQMANTTIEVVPQMFNWTEIGAVWGPGKNFKVFIALFQRRADTSSRVARRIIVLGDPILPRKDNNHQWTQIVGYPTFLPGHADVHPFYAAENVTRRRMLPVANQQRSSRHTVQSPSVYSGAPFAEWFPELLRQDTCLDATWFIWTVSCSTVACQLTFTHRRSRSSPRPSMARGAPLLPFVHSRYTFTTEALSLSVALYTRFTSTHHRPYVMGYALQMVLLAGGHNNTVASGMMVEMRLPHRLTYPRAIVCGQVDVNELSHYTDRRAWYIITDRLAVHIVLPAAMGKGSDLTELQKVMIIGFRAKGGTISETAAFVNCQCASVVKVYRQWTNGTNENNRRGNCGAPRTIDARVEQLTVQMNQVASRHVSTATVQLTLLRMGLRSRRRVTAPILTQVHRQKRLEFARQRFHNLRLADSIALLANDIGELQTLVSDIASECKAVGLGIDLSKQKKDKKKATDIRSATKVKDILEKTDTVKWQWADHVARTKDERWTKTVLPGED
ncbi:hypothetical protein PR048_028233 [Dryococelus australis]|uniref:Transposase Tc1-like domain-containing protein n=1 Tax=Dryococelus australis TaxID=614101 RepID=A0ABQ9GIP3_9NEOP|nr:hypothetical protein PR048_028233 [Dryococelus australis]